MFIDDQKYIRDGKVYRRTKIIDTAQDTKTKQGLSIGALWTLDQLAKQVNISKALGSSREAKLVLWLVLATVIEQGSNFFPILFCKINLFPRHECCPNVDGHQR